ncbi:MAG: hypothetical protein RR293_08565 [Bacteroidales bacterium]
MYDYDYEPTQREKEAFPMSKDKVQYLVAAKFISEVNEKWLREDLGESKKDEKSGKRMFKWSTDFEHDYFGFPLALSIEIVFCCSFGWEIERMNYWANVYERPEFEECCGSFKNEAAISIISDFLNIKYHG